MNMTTIKAGALTHKGTLVRAAHSAGRNVFSVPKQQASIGTRSSHLTYSEVSQLRSSDRQVICRGFLSNLFSGFRSTPNAAISSDMSKAPPPNAQKATLGGGCFWCLEACYQQLKGVYKVESAYAGGQVQNPTYEQVCGKGTGHAEVVQVTYDPDVITFKDLLDIFFTIHDPTTPNRQGNDAGPQYRSIILYHDEQQKKEAEEAMAKVTEEKWWGKPLVTELVPLNNYFPAEKYHQNYYANNPTQGYCSFVVGPKVQKFRAKFFKLLSA